MACLSIAWAQFKEGHQQTKNTPYFTVFLLKAGNSTEAAETLIIVYSPDIVKIDFRFFDSVPVFLRSITKFTEPILFYVYDSFSKCRTVKFKYVLNICKLFKGTFYSKVVKRQDR